MNKGKIYSKLEVIHYKMRLLMEFFTKNELSGDIYMSDPVNCGMFHTLREIDEVITDIMEDIFT